MIHKTGSPRAWYCRVLVDTYGAMPSVERDCAFPELVVQGETAFMPNDSEEMSYHPSWLAFHPEAPKTTDAVSRKRLSTRRPPGGAGRAASAYLEQPDVVSRDPARRPTVADF